MKYVLGYYNTDGSLEHLMNVYTKKKAKEMYERLKEEYGCTIWVQKVERINPREEFKTKKKDYDVILKFGDYTIISYEKQHMGTEYVIARNFNAEEFSWDSARDNYAYSMESALATLLSRLGSNFVKSQRQLEIERNTGITFDRACELASKFKDKIADDAMEFGDSDEDFLEFFTEECEMDEKELDFFGIKTESEEE